MYSLLSNQIFGQNGIPFVSLMFAGNVFSISACPRQGLLPGLQPHGPGLGREAEPGHLAGGLALRAQRQGRL